MLKKNLSLGYALINISMDDKLKVKLRIWFYLGEDKLLGIGRVELLERIKRTGSISEAAKEMKMSYRQAWQMVTEMNERSKSPFVEKQRGGTKGGGATITESGERAINAYNELEGKVKAFIEQEKDKIQL